MSTCCDGVRHGYQAGHTFFSGVKVLYCDSIKMNQATDAQIGRKSCETACLWVTFKYAFGWVACLKKERQGSLRPPGLEPGSKAWEASIIPLDHRRLDWQNKKILRFYIYYRHLFPARNSKTNRIDAPSANRLIYDKRRCDTRVRKNLLLLRFFFIKHTATSAGPCATNA